MHDIMREIEKLQEVCDHPGTQLKYYAQQEKKIVGCFPPYTPEELVYASGMIPMGMWGGHTEIKLAKSYLPPFACPIMQSNMEFALKNTYKGLSAVIIPAMCDTLRCMTQNWRFGVKDIPMIPIVYPQNRHTPASVDYLVSEYEQVLVMLATITGNMMTEKSLCHAINIYNEHNEIMRHFDAVANEHLDVITPKIRHTVHKSAFFYDKAEHTSIIKKIIQELEQSPVFEFSGKKVILTGISCEQDAVLDVLEENALAVVGDDLAQENRQIRTDTPTQGGGALKRLAEQWRLRRGCSLIHENGKPRGNILAKMCKETGAAGVINCMMKFCDPEEYDQPYLEEDLRNAGYPCITIEIDSQNNNLEQIRTRIQSFSEMI